jgi:hypothetical protein
MPVKVQFAGGGRDGDVCDRVLIVLAAVVDKSIDRVGSGQHDGFGGGRSSPGFLLGRSGFDCPADLGAQLRVLRGPTQFVGVDVAARELDRQVECHLSRPSGEHHDA